MEGIPSYEELSPGAERAAKRKRSVEIVETTNSPNTADKETRRLRFKDENRIDCWNLARMKKYYPDKYQELISKNAVQEKAESPVSASKPPKRIDWKEIFRHFAICLGIAVACFLVGLGLSMVFTNHQEISRPAEVKVVVKSETKVEQVILPPSVIDSTSSTPILLTPPNGIKNELLMSVAFTWSKVIGADSYEFVLSPYPDFRENKDLIRTITDTTAYEITWREGLCYSYSYFWRVRALTGDKAGEWSNINTFMTELLPLPPGPHPPAPPQS